MRLLLGILCLVSRVVDKLWFDACCVFLLKGRLVKRLG